MLKSIAAGAALALALAAPASAQLSGGEPLVVATTYTVKTAILEGESRKVTVRLPTGYEEEPERKYPVVYVLDGGPEQDFEHIAGIAQSRDMNWSFEPFILVGIESVNRRAELSPPVADPKPYEEMLRATPGGSQTYRRFLREELKPLVEASFRTDGHDAIMGESLAALFVVETLLKDPGLFDDYIAISPSMWWEEMQLAKEATAHFAMHPAGERRLYLTSANEGDWHREGTERLVDALRTSAPASLEWAFVEARESETHGTLYHPMALDAFRLLFPTPQREYKSYPLIGGPEVGERTAEEQARADTECTIENSRWTTPGVAAQGRERLYYECLLYDLGPQAREGTLGQ